MNSPLGMAQVIFRGQRNPTTGLTATGALEVYEIVEVEFVYLCQ